MAVARKSGTRTESASITMTTSRVSMSSNIAESAWLSAPAFFSVLATVVKTSAPCCRAISTVSSVQLSATTTIRSGGLVWPYNDSRVAAIVSASLCAGTSTVRRSGVFYASRSREPAPWKRKLGLLGESGDRRAQRSQHRPPEIGAVPARAVAGSVGPGPSTRIAAAACSAARPTKKAARAAPTATSNDTTGILSGPNGSCPTISFGATRWASHAANTKTPTANANRPTLRRLSRATRRRSGISFSTAKRKPPSSLGGAAATPLCLASRPEPTCSSSTDAVRGRVVRRGRGPSRPPSREACRFRLTS